MNPVYRTRWAAWSFIIAGIGCSLWAVLLRGGAVEWFLLAVLCGILLISGAAPALAAAGIAIARSLPEYKLLDGGNAEVRVTLRRALPVPFTWLALQDEAVNESAIHGGATSFRTVLVPMSRSEMAVTYTLRQLGRGLYRFSPLSITVGDWLGLTAIHLRPSVQGEFIVLPAVAPTEESQDAMPGPGKPVAGSKRHSQAADIEGAAGVRDQPAAVMLPGLGPDTRPYREGDSLRHLDFRAAARGRGLHTKTHAPEQAAETVIVIDNRASAYGEDDRLFDACVGWASYTAQRAADDGSAATLVAGDWSYTLPASHESEYRLRLSELQRQLALLRADGHARQLGGVRQSDLLQDNADERLDSTVRNCAAECRGGALRIFTGDWQSGQRWSELAAYASETGCPMELLVVSRNAVPSFAMREQQKALKRSKLKVTWLYVAPGKNKLPYAVEGVDAHAYA